MLSGRKCQDAFRACCEITTPDVFRMRDLKSSAQDIRIARLNNIVGQAKPNKQQVPSNIKFGNFQLTNTAYFPFSGINSMVLSHIAVMVSEGLTPGLA